MDSDTRRPQVKRGPLGGGPLSTNPLLCAAPTVAWASTASPNVLHESWLVSAEVPDKSHYLAFG